MFKRFKKIIRNKARKLIAVTNKRKPLEILKRYYFTIFPPKSVYFYTLHKCASTLFGGYFLEHINGLKKVDYAAKLYHGDISSDKEIEFKRKGYLYGPIRVSAGRRFAEGKYLVAQTTEIEFIKNKTAIFFIRDPRDILVSSYYSFGFTHPYSPVPEMREAQQAQKEYIQSLSVDEYVIQKVDHQVITFERIHELASICENSVVLKYEDMITKFDEFKSNLLRNLSVDDHVMEELFLRSRPKNNEDTTSHRRSGIVGGFREKLKPKTIHEINKKLNDVLTKFEYEK